MDSAVSLVNFDSASVLEHAAEQCTIPSTLHLHHQHHHRPSLQPLHAFCDCVQAFLPPTPTQVQSQYVSANPNAQQMMAH